MAQPVGQYGGVPQQQQQAPYAGQGYANVPPPQQQAPPLPQQQGFPPQQQQQYAQQQPYGAPPPQQYPAQQQAGYAPPPPPQQPPPYGAPPQQQQQQQYGAPPPGQPYQQQPPPGQWQQQAPPPGYGQPPAPGPGQYPAAPQQQQQQPYPPQQLQQQPYPPPQQQPYPPQQQQPQQPYPPQQPGAYGAPGPASPGYGPPPPQGGGPPNAPYGYGGAPGPLAPPPRAGSPPPGGYGLESEVAGGAGSGGGARPPLAGGPPSGGVINSAPPLLNRGGGPNSSAGIAPPPGSGGGFGLEADIGRGSPPQLSRAALQQQQQVGGLGSVGGALPAPQVGGYGLEADLSRANMGGPSYGLDADIAAAQIQRMNLGPTQQQQQGGYVSSPPRHAAPLPPLFTLDQLPPDQRVVHLTKVQANDLVQQLAIEAAHGSTAPPRVVDLADAHKHFVDSMTTKTYAYLHTVELSAPDKRLPANARASLLQAKLKHGHNRLQDLVQPTLEPGQQAFVDLAFTPDGALLEESARVWQCGLTLVRAEGIGPTGLRQSRQACLHVARLALFDRARNRFLGNVLGLRPDAVTNRDSAWQFRPQDRVVIRCNCVQPDPRTGTRLVNDDALSIYIEFNTSHKLDIADTKNMPPHEHRAAKMVDEVTTCWAMLNFRRCCQAAKDQEASVPLYYGSLYNPQSLDALYKVKRRKNPLSAVFKPKHTPTLLFKAGPLTGDPPPLLPFGFMPSTMLALDDLAWALGAYRVVMGLQLARQQTPFSALADPVLAAFPRLLGDNHLLTEFLVKWKDALVKLGLSTQSGCMAPQLLPPIAMVVELFRRCVAEVAPLLQSCTLPPRHINNFVEYQGHRLKLVQKFCHVIDPKTNTVVGSRHPVDPMSHAGFEFLHAPFDVAETRLCMADRADAEHNTFLKL